MGDALFWIISIIAPAILLILLIWLVFRNRNRPIDGGGETNARDNPVYEEDERRRREGTDDL